MSDAPEMFSQVKKKRGVGFTVLAVAGAVLVVLLIAGTWLLTRTEHPTTEGKQVEVRIPSGAGTDEIARMLSSYGVIKNGLWFELKAKLTRARLRSGTYELATGMPEDMLFSRLAAGPQVTYFDIPIPPGFTAKQVAARFAARAGVDQNELLQLVTGGAQQFAAKHAYLASAYNGSLEGYLWPATYRIKKGTKPADIIEMMLTKFDENTASLDLTYAKSKNLTLNDVVVIASILEREAKLSKDYPQVASVIYNRLHAKMRLQLDSTVFYVAPEGTTKLTLNDLWIQSPYNTYRNYGIPPGPICNPGPEALNAAAHPAQTKFMYYILGSKDGSQTFTVTYKQFLVAKKRYKAIFGQ